MSRETSGLGTASVEGLRRSSVDPDAHALTLFRVLPSGEPRAYTATTFPANPWQGCEHTIRMAAALGYLKDEGDGYGVLDVLNANAEIVQDFCVPSAVAFQWLKRRLDLRVADDESYTAAAATDAPQAKRSGAHQQEPSPHHEGGAR